LLWLDFLFFWQLDVELDALEPAEWQKFENKTPKKLKSTNTKANQILLQVQWECLDSLPTKLN